MTRTLTGAAVSGRMDIDIGLLEDCRRLAKQCKMADFMEELETKCKQLYDFGECPHLQVVLKPWYALR